MRFATLKEGNMYPFRTQILIVVACCVVHNFIRREQGDDFYFLQRQTEQLNLEDTHVDETIRLSAQDVNHGEMIRNNIATRLWLHN